MTKVTIDVSLCHGAREYKTHLTVSDELLGEIPIFILDLIALPLLIVQMQVRNVDLLHQQPFAAAM